MISYRDAVAPDAPALAAVARDTFVATFGHLYPAEDLSAFLAQACSVGTQAAHLADAETEIRLAIEGGALCGFCHIGAFKLSFDAGDRRPLELHRLYVVERAKGVGIAATLMDWALSRMRARGAEDAYLGVYQDNPRAHRFYQRYGFEVIGAYKFSVGATLDDEFVMRARLAP